MKRFGALPYFNTGKGVTDRTFESGWGSNYSPYPARHISNFDAKILTLSVLQVHRSSMLFSVMSLSQKYI